MRFAEDGDECGVRKSGALLDRLRGHGAGGRTDRFQIRGSERVLSEFDGREDAQVVVLRVGRLFPSRASSFSFGASCFSSLRSLFEVRIYSSRAHEGL